MATDNTYNGWTNYETWLVNLWIDNDQGSQEHYQELARETLQRCIDDDEDKDDAVSAFADLLKEEHEEAQDQCVGVSGVFADLLNAAMGSVDWREIARHYIDDIEVFAAGWNTPGCLPDNPPAMFLDNDDALEYIATEIERADEESEDENTDDEVEDACSEASEAAEMARRTVGEFGRTVGAYHYFVSRV